MQAAGTFNQGAGQSGGASGGQQNFTSASLYVGDLKAEVTEALLFEIFNAVGPVASIRVCRNAITRKSLGYAYVNFHNVIDAERALDTMNFTSIRGRPCRIMWCMRDPTLRKSGKGNIFVKNLDKTIDHKTLYDTFSMFGDILSCKVAMRELRDGKQESLGYGFVHYSTGEAATNAIAKVNGMEIAGKTVVVESFKPRDQRDSSPSKFTNVYIKNIPQGTNADSLVEELGKILGDMEISDKTGGGKAVYVKDQAHHFFKACWGCVDFTSAEKAEEAIQKINAAKMKLPGSEEIKDPLMAFPFASKRKRARILAKRFEARRAERLQKYAGVNVYIKNLHDTIDDERLKTEFDQFGDITSARVMRDDQNRSKGFGFVCFKLPDQATKAITEMNTKIVEGKPLYVALHQPRAVRDAQLAQRFTQQRQTNPMGGGGYQQQRGGPGQFGGMGAYSGGGTRGGMPMVGYNPVSYPQGPNMAPSGPPNMMGFPGSFNMGGGNNFRRNAGRPAPTRYNARGPRGPLGGGPREYHPRTTPGGPAVQQSMQAPPNPLSAQPQQLTAKMLSNADAQQQKQMIGERLFPAIQQREPKLAGKITGMLLEMDNTELLHLLESPQALNDKINEGLAVLREHNQLSAGASAE